LLCVRRKGSKVAEVLKGLQKVAGKAKRQKVQKAQKDVGKGVVNLLMQS
jgi:hypothetical protein